MTATADLYSLPDGLDGSPRHRRFPDSVGEGLQVVRFFLGRSGRKPDHVPSPRRRQPVGMGRAQVVAVRLDIGSQRSEHRGGVTVDIGQRAHRSPLACGPGADARTQRPTSLKAPLTVPVMVALSVPSGTVAGRRCPQKAGPRTSLTTADRIDRQAVTPPPGALCAIVSPAWARVGGIRPGCGQDSGLPAGLAAGACRGAHPGCQPLTGVSSVNGGNCDGPKPGPARIRRRDRHGRGLRGMLAPPESPLHRSRAERFDDLVLQAVSQLEPRWEAELAGIEFAVEEIPAADLPGDGLEPVPLARLDPGSPGPDTASAPARPARVVLYRRPLMARADSEQELGELVLDVVVEQFARLLGVDPEAADPGAAPEQPQGRTAVSVLRTAGSGIQVSELATGRIDWTVPPVLITLPA